MCNKICLRFIIALYYSVYILMYLLAINANNFGSNFTHGHFKLVFFNFSTTIKPPGIPRDHILPSCSRRSAHEAFTVQVMDTIIMPTRYDTILVYIIIIIITQTLYDLRLQHFFFPPTNPRRARENETRNVWSGVARCTCAGRVVVGECARADGGGWCGLIDRPPPVHPPTRPTRLVRMRHGGTHIRNIIL